VAGIRRANRRPDCLDQACKSHPVLGKPGDKQGGQVVKELSFAAFIANNYCNFKSLSF
jgi:hypothetical protein